eukprot:4010427-Prorocentrum_lima.AAC.1
MAVATRQLPPCAWQPGPSTTNSSSDSSIFVPWRSVALHAEGPEGATHGKQQRDNMHVSGVSACSKQPSSQRRR